MSGWLFLGGAALMSVALFLHGLRFARMTENPWAGQRLLGMPVGGSDASVETVRRLGLLFMIAGPLFLLLVAALCFGLLGRVDGIETILLI
jgi:ABC-type Fe3+-siderophore transport system permease subunit